jgi:hypothetical protein
MNRMDEESRWIDRLVDGELDTTERRALLARFEREPDGWRRCALAFLESQSWREALRLRAEPVASGVNGLSQTLSPPPRESTSTWRPRRWRRLAAIAAGWIVAFAAGWMTGGGSRETTPGMASRTTQAPGVARPDRETNNSPTTRPVSIAEVPVLKIRQPSEPASPAPETIRRSLEHRGFQVEPRQGLVSVKLKDGRRVALPVDALKFRYVGGRTL